MLLPLDGGVFHILALFLDVPRFRPQSREYNCDHECRADLRNGVYRSAARGHKTLRNEAYDGAWHICDGVALRILRLRSRRRRPLLGRDSGARHNLRILLRDGPDVHGKEGPQRASGAGARPVLLPRFRRGANRWGVLHQLAHRHKYRNPHCGIRKADRKRRRGSSDAGERDRLEIRIPHRNGNLRRPARSVPVILQKRRERRLSLPQKEGKTVSHTKTRPIGRVFCFFPE